MELSYNDNIYYCYKLINYELTYYYFSFVFKRNICLIMLVNLVNKDNKINQLIC